MQQPCGAELSRHTDDIRQNFFQIGHRPKTITPIRNRQRQALPPHWHNRMNSSPEELLCALALTKPLPERAAFLDRECASDPALRHRLEALLAAHEQPDTLLATKADTARPTIKLDLGDAPDEAVGQTLGRYKLLERVGEEIGRAHV